MSTNVLMNLVNTSYFICALLFILGLKRMSSPLTAQGGIVMAGWGMLVGTLATFAHPEILKPLAAAVRAWGMDRAALNARARALWQGGYRPSLGAEVSAGSGSDVVDPLEVG